MTPVCPACRASIRLDTFVCGKCGLAVRPTCAHCSEPLTVGMRTCWRCRTEIEEPPVEREPEKREPEKRQPEKRQPISVAAAAAGMAVENPAGPAMEAVEGFAQRQQPEPVTEAIEHVPHPPDATAAMPPPPIQHTPAPPVAPVRVMEPWPASSDRRRKRFRPGRVLIIGILAGLLVAGGLVVGEGVSLRYRYPDPRTISLGEQPFAELGFSVSVPARWTVDTADNTVTFADPGRPDDRGWRVVAEPADFEAVRDGVDPSNRTRFSSFIRLAPTTEEVISGRSALRSEFIGNDLEYRQWWVDGGRGRTFRIESWFHPAEGDETVVLDERMIETFEVL